MTRSFDRVFASATRINGHAPGFGTCLFESLEKAAWKGIRMAEQVQPVDMGGDYCGALASRDAVVGGPVPEANPAYSPLEAMLEAQRMLLGSVQELRQREERSRHRTLWLKAAAVALSACVAGGGVYAGYRVVTDGANAVKTEVGQMWGGAKDAIGRFINSIRPGVDEQASAQAYIDGLHFPGTVTVEEVDATLHGERRVNRTIQVPFTDTKVDIPASSSSLTMDEKGKLMVQADLARAQYKVERTQLQDGTARLDLVVTLDAGQVNKITTVEPVEIQEYHQLLGDNPDAIAGADLSNVLKHQLQTCAVPYLEGVEDHMAQIVRDELAVQAGITQQADPAVRIPTFDTVSVHVTKGGNIIDDTELAASLGLPVATGDGTQPAMRLDGVTVTTKCGSRLPKPRQGGDQ